MQKQIISRLDRPRETTYSFKLPSGKRFRFTVKTMSEMDIVKEHVTITRRIK
jgi:hypothetical protein